MSKKFLVCPAHQPGQNEGSQPQLQSPLQLEGQPLQQPHWHAQPNQPQIATAPDKLLQGRTSTLAAQAQQSPSRSQAELVHDQQQVTDASRGQQPKRQRATATIGQQGQQQQQQEQHVPPAAVSNEQGRSVVQLRAQKLTEGVEPGSDSEPGELPLLASTQMLEHATSSTIALPGTSPRAGAATSGGTLAARSTADDSVQHQQQPTRAATRGSQQQHAESPSAFCAHSSQTLVGVVSSLLQSPPQHQHQPTQQLQPQMQHLAAASPRYVCQTKVVGREEQAGAEEAPSPRMTLQPPWQVALASRAALDYGEL